MRPRKQPQTQSMLLTAEMLADRGFRLAGIEGGEALGAADCEMRSAASRRCSLPRCNLMAPTSFGAYEGTRPRATWTTRILDKARLRKGSLHAFVRLLSGCSARLVQGV